MSTGLVAAEIRRFLASKDAEVLCITGKWGVGKTFAWRKYLADAEATKASAFDRYSYVSLFGLNSLDDLRYSVVEGTVLLAQSAKGPTIETMAAFLKEKLGKGQPIVNMALAYLGKKDVGAALAKAAYLAIRTQLICFDDLERAGKGLDARDVLGLASSLKEQRGCKVVLLLNDEQMKEEDRAEFERQLEKVVDVSLVFDPTSPEAAAIALSGTDPVSDMLRDRVVKLDIVNIRVIKKIERLAKRLAELLQGFSQPVLEQAMSTVTLGTWAVLQPADAPAVDFIRSYNRFTVGLRKKQGEDEQVVEVEQKWHARLGAYPYSHADELDLKILAAVERGFFDDAALVEAATVIEKNRLADPDTNSFSKAWESLHGSLTIDDNDILNGLFAGAMENLANISVMNMNSTICLFRAMGRGEQADEMLNAFIAEHADKRAFFALSSHCFMASEEIDLAMSKAFRDRYDSFVDDRDPRKVLLAITNSSSWSDTDWRLLANVSTDNWVRLFDDLNGRELPAAIEMAQRLAAQPGEHHDHFQSALQTALEQVAARSHLRARRMRRFGISLAPVTTAAPGTDSKLTPAH